MKKLSRDELIEITGGTVSFNSSYLNAIYKVCDLIFGIGRELGSSIRRVSSDKVCELK